MPLPPSWITNSRRNCLGTPRSGRRRASSRRVAPFIDVLRRRCAFPNGTGLCIGWPERCLPLCLRAWALRFGRRRKHQPIPAGLHPPECNALRDPIRTFLIPVEALARATSSRASPTSDRPTRTLPTSAIPRPLMHADPRAIGRSWGPGPVRLEDLCVAATGPIRTTREGFEPADPCLRARPRPQAEVLLCDTSAVV